MTILIKGPYDKDDNFTHVYSCDTMFVLARNSKDWGCVKVGERMYDGNILTQELLNRWRENAKYKTGIFEIGGYYPLTKEVVGYNVKYDANSAT